MADLPPYPDSGNAGVGPDGGSPPSTPRWVKLFGIVLLVLVLLVAIIMITGVGGEHGPGRHMAGSGLGGHTPTSSVTEQVVQQP
jgi:hypothetical protein